MIKERIGGKSLVNQSVKETRERFICAALQGLLANPQTPYQIMAKYGDVTEQQSYVIIAQTAINIADVAIAESKKVYNKL
jgi:hypothetical protein